MLLDWDEHKRHSNIEKHGYDFEWLDIGFFRRALIRPGRSGRYRAYGLLGGRMIVVIVRPMGREALSVISMRVAGTAELKRLTGSIQADRFVLDLLADPGDGQGS